MSEDLVVIDISHWQTEPDWLSLKAAGIVGVILKATEGTSYEDPTFKRRRIDAYNAGFATGSYHFLRPKNIRDQMEWYLSVATPDPGERVVVDFEDPDCTEAEVEEAVTVLMEAGLNLQIAVYGSSSFLSYKLGASNPILSANTSLWLAHYTAAAAPSGWPTGIWPAWSLWQYTDEAVIEGWGPIDGNRFNGSLDQCLAWMWPAPVVPTPVPPFAPEVSITVHVKVEAPPNVKVNIVLE